MKHKKHPSQGQALLEFNLVTLLIVLPLVMGVVFWYDTEWNRSKCANETFFQARRQLIITHAPVHHSQHCGSIYETVDLVPLANLDQTQGAALSVGDLTKEASRLLESVLHSSPSSLPSASFNSW